MASQSRTPGLGGGPGPGYGYDPFGGYSGPTQGPTIGFKSSSLGDLGQQYCERFGIPPEICALGRAAADRWLGGGGDAPGSSSPATQLVPRSCPDGYRVSADGLSCEREGLVAAGQRFLPGGQTGTLADRYGEAVIGGFGIPGLVPAVVGSRQNARGEVNPILECPSGAVLGKDNICYMKGSIPKSFRKWPPAPRAPVTASDAKAIRKANSARNRVKKLAGNVGFKCSPKRGR